MKEFSKLLSSFNLRCGLSFSADMSGQPMAVYMKVCATYTDPSIFVVGLSPADDMPGRPMAVVSNNCDLDLAKITCNLNRLPAFILA